MARRLPRQLIRTDTAGEGNFFGIRHERHLSLTPFTRRNRDDLAAKEGADSSGTAAAETAPTPVSAHAGARNLDDLAAEKGADSRWHGGCRSNWRSQRRARGAVGAMAPGAFHRSGVPTSRIRHVLHTIRVIPFTSPCARRAVCGHCDQNRPSSALVRAFTAANRDAFRVVHFSVQTDHVHLIVEADSRDDLRRGLNSLNCTAARAVNRAWQRSGPVWGDRYHARALTTPREVRNGLVYVLLNFRKHLRAPPLVDPLSSGAWFDGWSHNQEPPSQPSPVAGPRTWLGTVGWRRAGGLIRTAETPGAK